MDKRETLSKLHCVKTRDDYCASAIGDRRSDSATAFGVRIMPLGKARDVTLTGDTSSILGS